MANVFDVAQILSTSREVFCFTFTVHANASSIVWYQTLLYIVKRILNKRKWCKISYANTD